MRNVRESFLALLVVVVCAAPAEASDDKLEVREGYEEISAVAFRKLPRDTPDGRRFTIHYQKFNKLFVGKDLKIYGGMLNGRGLKSHLAGLVQIEQKKTRERLINNLKANQDSDGLKLSPKKSNIQLFGIGLRTPKGYVLMVNRVHRLCSLDSYYSELAAALPDGDAQQRLDLVRQISYATKFYETDRIALEPLVQRLRREARDAEFAKLPELPNGVNAYIQFARRHDEIATLSSVWNHEGVAEADKARVAKTLRDSLGAVLYLGEWYSEPDFKKRLGFVADGDAWIPKGLVVLKEFAQIEKKRRGKLELGGGQVDRKLLEIAMRNGDVIAGMTKPMVVAARGGFPIDVNRWREEISRGTLVWERWELEDGYLVFFCNNLAFKKIKPGASVDEEKKEEEK
jgi:hypothetical protein